MQLHGLTGLILKAILVNLLHYKQQAAALALNITIQLTARVVAAFGQLIEPTADLVEVVRGDIFLHPLAEFTVALALLEVVPETFVLFRAATV